MELSEGLAGLGHEVSVSIPPGIDFPKGESYRGVNVISPANAEGILSLIADAKPDIVHFHPLFLDNTIDLIEGIARSIPVVVSYHTPTLTCMRADLLHMGREVCDGIVEYGKCASCVLQARGLGVRAAKAAGKVPGCVFRVASHFAAGRLRSALEWPVRTAGLRRNMDRLWKACTRLIVVCDWLKGIVVANGMPEDLVSTIRYGRTHSMQRPRSQKSGPLRLGYAGRLTREKGVDLMLEALELIPDARLTVEFCAPEFEANSHLADRIRRAAEQDRRIIIRGAVDPGCIVGVMSGWDAVLVPSIWMETGPMVVTEAFHAGVPVIGSNRGGIAELVSDGVNGILFEAGSKEALTEIIERLAEDPASLRNMAYNITGGRDTMQMVREIESVYRRICI
jgi:glycosyltransferase involved in cell wall biosynthesis